MDDAQRRPAPDALFRTTKRKCREPAPGRDDGDSPPQMGGPGLLRLLLSAAAAFDHRRTASFLRGYQRIQFSAGAWRTGPPEGSRADHSLARMGCGLLSL